MKATPYPKIIQVLLETVFLIIVICIALNGTLTLYLLQQARGQFLILTGTVDCRKVLRDEQYPQTLRDKLAEVEQIRTFALNYLGLRKSESYTSFFDQKGKPLLYMVTASKPLRMEEYLWEYPLLGKLGYKGFFRYDLAKAEIRRLKAQGYETDCGQVAGWSLLGWWPDPVLSSMLERESGDLAELLIHELFHGTIYVAGNSNFNENMANACGKAGAEQYLLKYYGRQHPKYRTYIAELGKEHLVNEIMLKAAVTLDSLYNCPLPDSIKKQYKKRIIFNTCVAVFASKRIKYASRRKICSRLLMSRNAYLMSYKRYDEKETSFRNEILQDYHGNIREWLKFKTDSLKGLTGNDH